MDQGEQLAELRAQVARAHASVAAGEYAAAVSGFREALEPLRSVLGAEHPEVEELADDLRTAAEMAGVADFGDAAGFGWRRPGGPPSS